MCVCVHFITQYRKLKLAIAFFYVDVILQPAPAITFRPIGGIFDFYVMLGPSPKDVSRQYSNIVGKTFMPPFWSLGFQLCRWGYDSLEETKKAMDRTIAAGIPLVRIV